MHRTAPVTFICAAWKIRRCLRGEFHNSRRISSFVKVLDDVAEISDNDTKPRPALQFKFRNSKLLYATLYHTINSSSGGAV
jgi:hypothetical protein